MKSKINKRQNYIHLTLNVYNFDAKAKSETKNFSVGVNLIVRLGQSQYQIGRIKKIK